MSTLSSAHTAPDEPHFADRPWAEDVLAVMVLDREVSNELIRERREKGIDAHDEVWDGVYMVMPIANREHQKLVGGLTTILTNVLEASGSGEVYPGLNVSDRGDDWERNYRCPDVAVYLRENSARSFPAHYQGGPDLAIEIVSPKDRSRDKLDFYARIGTREVLIIDREPWRLELYRLNNGVFGLVGTSELGHETPLASDVVPLRFRLMPGPSRAQVEIAHADGAQQWLV